MTTIYFFSKGKEEQPRVKSLVSNNEEVSGRPASGVQMRKLPADIDNGRSAKSVSFFFLNILANVMCMPC